MMTRAEAQRVLLKSLDNDGKEWDDIVFSAVKKGKNSWTKREVYDAILNDRSVEGDDYNPIDSLLRFEEWKKNGRK